MRNRRIYVKLNGYLYEFLKGILEHQYACGEHRSAIETTFVPSVTLIFFAKAGSISTTASSPLRAGVPAVGFLLLCMPVHPAKAVR
jgi:hypothetical protein